MCGIAAIFNYRALGTVDRLEMRRMLDRMRNRGPDGEGEWYSPERQVGLGHKRLAIIDLSEKGAQPMHSRDGNLVITFNGEIYNYEALRRDLVARGCEFNSSCDTEVILELYRLEGERMVEKLRGMFALAIWDRGKRTLFLARDHLGIKPLYYADDGKTFRAASQIKALRATQSIDLTPGAAGGVGLFLWGHVPEPYTLYKNIRSLPAGSMVTVTEHGPGPLRTYCNVAEELSAAAQAAPPRSGAEVAEAVREALVDSVRHHLVADVPVGVFLSAGIDSTTITALVTETGVRLKTVTLAFEEFRGTPNDESCLAEVVARKYGAEHRAIWITRQEFYGQFHALLDAMDSPSIDGVNSYFISRAARQAGLKVVLSGVGGDELFGGYSSFSQLPRLARSLRPFAHFPLQQLGRTIRATAAPVVTRFWSPKYASLLEYGGSLDSAYLLYRSLFLPWELPAVLDERVLQDGLAELETIPQLRQSMAGVVGMRKKISALELQWYMRNQLLRDTDWASMAHSVEVRTPLVDIALLRRLAPMLGQPTATKRALAAAPRVPLPSEVLNRPKTGFSVPVQEWLMSHEVASAAARSPRRLTLFSSARVDCDELSRHQLGRGLRRWARVVYSKYVADDPAGGTLLRGSHPLKILVFRTGQLGDTIVSLPALWAVREQFPDAKLTLLSDRHIGWNYVLGADLFAGGKIFDRFLFYPVSYSVRHHIVCALQMMALLVRLRVMRFDLLIYMPPTPRTDFQVSRDRRFFAAAGIKFVAGMTELHEPALTRPLVRQPFEADVLLQRLAADGIRTAPAGRGRMDLGLGSTEDRQVEKWKSRLGSDGGRLWLGVGPSSKMQAKRWPAESFATVVNELIEEFDVWPVVFGGREDYELAEDLIRTWKRGFNAAGALNLRAAARALSHCRLYVGNDTGTMHLAAAVGTKCVAVFSARDFPGRWEPYGTGHRILRKQIECEGCRLFECIEKNRACLLNIHPTEVTKACRELLQTEGAAVGA